MEFSPSCPVIKCNKMYVYIKIMLGVLGVLAEGQNTTKFNRGFCWTTQRPCIHNHGAMLGLQNLFEVDIIHSKRVRTPMVRCDYDLGDKNVWLQLMRRSELDLRLRDKGPKQGPRGPIPPQELEDCNHPLYEGPTQGDWTIIKST